MSRTGSFGVRRIRTGKGVGVLIIIIVIMIIYIMIWNLDLRSSLSFSQPPIGAILFITLHIIITKFMPLNPASSPRTPKLPVRDT